MNVGMFVLVILVYFAIGLLASELGLTASPVPAPSFEQPESGLLKILEPVRWIINGATGIIQLVTFTWDGPGTVKALLGIPLGSALVYTIAKLWGGGG